MPPAEQQCKEIVFTLAAPGPWITANHRMHWAVRADRTRRWREVTAWTAKRLRIPHFDRMHITCLLHFRLARRRDPANWAPTAKACVDGLVDAGVVDDDDDTHVIGPDMRIGPPGGRAESVVFMLRDAGNGGAR